MRPTMGKCPKCLSENVFVKNGDGVGFDVMLKVGLGFGMRSTVEWLTYLCTDCGYFENYLTKQDWLQEIKTNPKGTGWRKSE